MLCLLCVILFPETDFKCHFFIQRPISVIVKIKLFPQFLNCVAYEKAIRNGKYDKENKTKTKK